MEKTQIISQLTHVEPCEPAVLTIGFFDGVHRGHQHVIRHVIDRSLQYGARAVLVTFWPHPQRVLHPEKPKPLLTTLQEKLELLVTQGDRCCCRPGCSRANMLLDPVKLLPASGVYTIRVQLPENEQSSRLGVAYVGRCPNCGEGIPALVEVHLLVVLTQKSVEGKL